MRSRCSQRIMLIGTSFVPSSGESQRRVKWKCGSSEETPSASRADASFGHFVVDLSLTLRGLAS